jgi:hypothetical protein
MFRKKISSPGADNLTILQTKMACRKLMEKLIGKRPLDRCKSTWVVNIKTCLMG